MQVQTCSATIFVFVWLAISARIRKMAIVLAGPRTRLRKSVVSYQTIGKSLEKWMDALGDRHLDATLVYYRDNWNWTCMPSTSELTSRVPHLLADAFVDGMPDLNPGLLMTSASVVSLDSEDKEKKCLFSTAPGIEARLIAGAIRLVLSKYRTLKYYPKKLEAVLKRALPEEETAIRNIVGRINLDQSSGSRGNMDSSGSRENTDVMPLLDSGGAGDELDDMMSEDEIDSELKKIATGQNHFLLLFFCFPMFTKPTRSEPSCAPPHGMVWTAGLPPYVMVWAVGLSLYGMVWTARFSLLWYGLGCRAFYRFVCLVNASTCFPKMTHHFKHIRLLSTDAGRGRFLERSISDELAVIERHQGPQPRRLRNHISSEVEITEVRPRPPPAVMMDVDRLAAIEPLPPKKGSVSRSCTTAKKAKAAAAKANAKGGKADAKGNKAAAAAAAVPKANAKGGTAAAAVPKANAKEGKAAVVQKTNAKEAKAAKAVKAKKIVAAAKAAVKAVVAAAVGGAAAKAAVKPLKMEEKNIKCRAYRAAERKATHEGLSIEEIIEARTNAYAVASLPE